MENIDFVLWVILWPLMIKVDSYLTMKMNVMKGSSIPEEKPNADKSVVIIWIVIGLILFFN